METGGNGSLSATIDLAWRHYRDVTSQRKFPHIPRYVNLPLHNLPHLGHSPPSLLRNVIPAISHCAVIPRTRDVMHKILFSSPFSAMSFSLSDIISCDVTHLPWIPPSLSLRGPELEPALLCLFIWVIQMFYYNLNQWQLIYLLWTA